MNFLFTVSLLVAIVGYIFVLISKIVIEELRERCQTVFKASKITSSEYISLGWWLEINKISGAVCFCGVITIICGGVWTLITQYFK